MSVESSSLIQNAKRSTFDIPHARISLLQAGDSDGSPILFLHGYPDSGALWHPTVAHMDSDDYHYLIPDLPAFGQSTATKAYSLSLENRAQFVEEVLLAGGVDMAEEEPVTVVVHDHGGPFGLAWAVLHPEHLRALIITNTVFHRDYEWHYWARVWRKPLLGEFNMFIAQRFYKLWAREIKRGSKGMPEAHLLQTFKGMTPTMKRMALRLYRATDSELFAGWDHRLYDLVGKIPTLVLWGEQDPYIPLDFALRLQEYGATLKLYPEYGHWLMMEAPQIIAHQIKSFLRDL